MRMSTSVTLSLADLSETLAVCVVLGGAQTADIAVTFKLASIFRVAKKLREEHFGADSPFNVARTALADEHTLPGIDSRPFKSPKDADEFRRKERLLLNQQVTVQLPALDKSDLTNVKLFDVEDGKRVRVEITPFQIDAIMCMLKEDK